jgi:ribosomal protein S27AE
MCPRRPSLLEDDELVEIDEPSVFSSGDVCERCGCARAKHSEDECACGKCEGFAEG